MNILDAILLICFIPALIQGIRKGLISQVIAIISLILSIWLAFRFASPTGEWLAGFIKADIKVLNVMAFALILIVVSVIMTLLSKLIEALIHLIMLGWLNKLLGAVFSIAKYSLLIGMVILLFDSLNTSFDLVDKDTLNASILYNPLKEIADTVFPYLKSLATGNL